jgi:hypothetical protein
MTNEKNLKRLEKEIFIKMSQIKSGKLLPKDSGIGKMINLMKSFDEPLYNKILAEYKNILASLN